MVSSSVEDEHFFSYFADLFIGDGVFPINTPKLSKELVTIYLLGGVYNTSVLKVAKPSAFYISKLFLKTLFHLTSEDIGHHCQTHNFLALYILKYISIRIYILRSLLPFKYKANLLWILKTKTKMCFCTMAVVRPKVNSFIILDKWQNSFS